MKTIGEVLESVIQSGYEFAKERFENWEVYCADFLDTTEIWDNKKRPVLNLLSEGLYEEAGMAAMHWYPEDYGLKNSDDFETFESNGYDPGAFVVEGVERFLKEYYPDEFV